jgi:hypothetical protein
MLKTLIRAISRAMQLTEKQTKDKLERLKDISKTDRVMRLRSPRKVNGTLPKKGDAVINAEEQLEVLSFDPVLEIPDFEQAVDDIEQMFREEVDRVGV